ncbi:VPA0735-like protein [Gracilaria domingensis]|nr:VPA0735-like protein [Gracilaria domingensis]
MLASRLEKRRARRAERRGAKTSAQDDIYDWEDNYVYALGVQAYIYGYPWVYMPTAYREHMEDGDGTVNAFNHGRELKDHNHLYGGMPNNDTLYSMAPLYLGEEPLIMSVPAVDRTRATGSEAGHYAIIGPTWSGTLPDEVVELPHSLTPLAYIAGRTYVDGKDDLETVHAIQDQYKLTPLSQFIDRNATPKAVPRGFDMPDPNDPLRDWKIMNFAMAENPHTSKTTILWTYSLGLASGQV